MLDALATAELAATRCARYLGASETTAATPLPRHGCDEREYALLEMHRTALAHMVRWGVADADADARRQVAYDIAMRRATVASVQ
jgi:hypothetical protein